MKLSSFFKLNWMRTYRLSLFIADANYQISSIYARKIQGALKLDGAVGD